MHARVSTELEVKQAASKVWEIYGTLKLAKLIMQNYSDVIEKIEIEGDGGVGTVLTYTFPKGARAYDKIKEKVVVVDNDKRVKAAEVVEGGYLVMGYNSYRTTFEMAEDEAGGSSSCIIRSSIDYEIDDENASYKSLVPVSTVGFEKLAKTVAEHLAESNRR